MTISSRLIGRNKTVAKVDDEGQLNVIVHPHPPIAEQKSALPYRSYFTLNADGSTFDMRVDGSTTQQHFCINASNVYDRYIKTISVVIADVNAALNKFGNLAELTNGIEFQWFSQRTGTVVIADSIKTNFEFIRIAAGNPSFGDGAGAFKANNVQGSAEGYIPIIDCAVTFGLPYGLRIKKDTTESIQFIIKDDLSTGLDAFNIIGYGLEI